MINKRKLVDKNGKCFCFDADKLELYKWGKKYPLAKIISLINCPYCKRKITRKH